ncbi:methyl-accepting chemotaxis protein [Azospirillum halopraeferens]|uniref:methyl-accepting chemotaxis protein n=1 Tax=Azospirillum halopraeferens TaxID=34010 RepID=UPI00146FB31F|nr:HAMP domain-containing methyl-accepting chemotaxis protein [Azospirillum halopraeferens]
MTLTIGRKILLTVAVGLVIGFGVSAALQITGERGRMLAVFDDGRMAVSHLLADNMAAAVRFNRTQAMIGAYANLRGPNGDLGGLVVLDADGKELHRFVDPDRPAFAFDAAVGGLRSAVQGSRAAVVEAHPEHTVVAVPVVQGAQDAMTGVLVVAWDRSRALAGAVEATRMQLGLAAVIVGLLLGSLAFALRRIVIGPVVALTAAMGRLAGGEKDVTIPGTGRRDEMGAMATAVEVFRRNAVEVDRLQAEQAAQKARAEEERRRQMLSLADGFQTTVGGVIADVSGETALLEQQSRVMADAAGDTDRLAASVATATEEASSHVQTVAAASEELSNSITEIGRQVSDSSRVTADAVMLARQANDKVEGLAAAIQRIGSVVDLINSIAGQTNLLALNATIEAARAGDAGKGFAVVASEVKQLANQTARATDEISGQVASIQAATGEAVQEIRDVGRVIERMNQIATAIASAVEEQGAATQEIARSVQQAASSTRLVSSSIQGVSKAADVGGQAARELLDRARRLAHQADTLTGEVDGFLRSVRAG